MEVREVDFLVIGSGPAGQKGAIAASKNGRQVVVIEAYEAGGSSLWWGTIPSKSLREAILDLTNFKAKSFYATTQNLPQMKDISISDLNHRKEWSMQHLKSTILRQLKKNKIELIQGFAKFIDPYTVEVYYEDRLIAILKAKQILLTPGSRPRDPGEICSLSSRIFTSTDLLKIDAIPKSMIVIGAGVIGSEYASMFCILGTKVTLVDKRPRILSFLDREIGSHLQLALEENNLRFIGNKDYESVKDVNGEVVVTFKDGSEIRAETALVAAGREANVDGLYLDRAGIEVKRGDYLHVDEHYRTTVPHIYAAGDVIGGLCLSSVSYDQGRIAAMNACGHKINRFQLAAPIGIYTIPEISTIGKTEEELKEANIQYEVGRAYFYEVSRSVITGSESGLCKLLFCPKKLTLYGAHIIGNAATELIHIAQVAISFNAKIDYFLEQVFNFPTFAEMYRIASLNGLNKLRG